MRFLAALHRDNRQLFMKLAVVVALMFGFGYAMVPLYKAICNALGINVLSLSEKQTLLAEKGVANGNGQIDFSREITVEFDTNARGPWDFKPAVRHLTVHPGELTQVMYEFKNVQDRTMAALACMGAFQQARVLLLQRIHAEAGREQAVAGRLRHRPQAAQGCEDHHPVLYLLRGGGQGRGQARRSAQVGSGAMSDKLGQDLKEAVGRKVSFLQTISAVAWSFFGVRRSKDHENDMAKLNPVHVLIAGVLGAALFVLVLVLLVRWVISSGVAGA